MPIEEPDLVQVLFDEDGNLIADVSRGVIVGLSELICKRDDVPKNIDGITTILGHDNWFMLAEDIAAWIELYATLPAGGEVSDQSAVSADCIMVGDNAGYSKQEVLDHANESGDRPDPTESDRRPTE